MVPPPPHAPLAVMLIKLHESLIIAPDERHSQNSEGFLVPLGPDQIGGEKKLLMTAEVCPYEDASAAAGDKNRHGGRRSVGACTVGWVKTRYVSRADPRQEKLAVRKLL